MKLIIKKVLSATLMVLFVLLSARIDLLTANAASLTSISDTLSNATFSAASNHTILFTTPTGITAGQTITLTFPAGYNISTIAFGDVDMQDNGTDITLAASAATTTWGVGVAGQVLTITSATGTVTAGHAITIKIGTNATFGTTGTHQIVNTSSTGTSAITIGGTMADSGTATVYILTNGVVAVTATVTNSLSFAISSNSISFGTLSSGAPQYANTTTGSASDTTAHTLAIGTNGTSGYTITVQGATLTSGANTITAIGATPATSAAGTSQFGIYATKAGGVNGTIATPYATTSSFGYNGTATTAATFATGTTPTATETYSLHYIANISALTPAGSYATNLTYVGTANF